MSVRPASTSRSTAADSLRSSRCVMTRCFMCRNVAFVAHRSKTRRELPGIRCAPDRHPPAASGR
jgi:hypothetical protein